MKDLTYLKRHYKELKTYDFYRFIFPVGSFENEGSYLESKPNGMLLFKKEDKYKKHIITDDLKEIVSVAKSGKDCFISPIGYFGRTPKKDNARLQFALVFDIDFLRLKEDDGFLCPVDRLISCLFEDGNIPIPTANLLALSSEEHVHIYYVFEEPTKMYKSVMPELEEFKKLITRFIWRSDFIDTKIHKIQYESIVQGFRIVGSKNSKHDNIVHGFMLREKKYKNINDLITQMNQINNIYKRSNISLIDLSVKNGKTNKKKHGHWTCKKDLYDWYKNIFMTDKKVIEGSRYRKCFTLASIAYKCGVSKKELKRDLLELAPKLDQETMIETKKTPFTTEDALSALKGYSEEYVNVGIDFIKKKAMIEIERNRRNGRTQKQHLRIARLAKELKKESDSNYHYHSTKKEVVENRQLNHVGGSKEDCRRDTKLSRNTIYKYRQS